jgi:hypothetical protein
VEIADLGLVLAELQDKELVFHGFTPYMRDYEVVVYEPVDRNPKHGLVPRHLRFLFKYCTEATVTSRVRPDVWARSLSDDLLKVHHVSRGSPGYVWGVEAQELFPGATVVQGSSRAAYWADQLGLAFHEVLGSRPTLRPSGWSLPQWQSRRLPPATRPSSSPPPVMPKPTPTARASPCPAT